MRSLVAILLMTLAACNTPSARFRNVAPVRISVSQSTFDVRISDNRAEAVRINPEWAPNRKAVASRAVAAIEKVSGCRVHDLDGDQAVIVARLDCGSGPPPSLLKSRTLDCELYEIYDGYGDLTCRAYP